MDTILFLAVLLGGLLLGAYVSRWRERRVLPIWTWSLTFAAAWAWGVYRTGARAWYGADGAAQVSTLAALLILLVLFVLGSLACTVAAMTAGRGKR